ncbi:hypothetical protein [Hydrogenophaga intermedia]|jgi:hypothetical protein|uniref:hypothetical protein n=1 Tax=Hydrogenophaga intermedia TaxID=65786 RepID=UPI002042D282|nr:hypothetical protein [Hydrogenophaga intermedia]MCM3564281.1 hypothetical protein [Hydrogenophaga intermedia]
MRLLAPFLWLVFAASSAMASGDVACTTNREGRIVCPPPEGRCLTNRYGDVLCSNAGGGILANRYGDLVCGPGNCVRDQRGDVFCSNQPHGAVAIDRYGAAACAGACVPASASACVRPQPQR